MNLRGALTATAADVLAPPTTQVDVDLQNQANLLFSGCHWAE